MRISVAFIIFIFCSAIYLMPLPVLSKIVLNRHNFVGGHPDTRVKFPQLAFDQAKKLKDQRRYTEAENLLMAHLEQARKASRGKPELAKYLVRLNNILYDAGKIDDSIEVGTIASELLSRSNSADLIGWKVNIESYLGFAFSHNKDYRKAIQKYKEALILSDTAPPGKVAPIWIETLKTKKKAAEKNAR